MNLALIALSAIALLTSYYGNVTISVILLIPVFTLLGFNSHKVAEFSKVPPAQTMRKLFSIMVALTCILLIQEKYKHGPWLYLSSVAILVTFMRIGQIEKQRELN